MTGQLYAIFETESGELRSVATVVADPLPEHLTAIPVDGPGDGRAWDPQTRAWGPASSPTEPAPGTPAELNASIEEIRAAVASATTIAGLRAAFLEFFTLLAPTE